jgi:hypothetical protein
MFWFVVEFLVLKFLVFEFLAFEFLVVKFLDARILVSGLVSDFHISRLNKGKILLPFNNGI